MMYTADNRIASFFALLFGGGLLLSTVWGQSLAGRKPQGYPSCYLQMLETSTVDGNGDCKAGASNNPWIVYGAVANVATSTGKALEFMQPFYVADEDEARVRLVRYDTAAVQFVSGKYRFTAKAEDWGWIARKELLLWGSALVDVSHQLPLQAFPVNNLKFGQLPGYKWLVYNGYEQIPFRCIDSSLSRFGIYYVYRIENGAYLLGKKSSLSVDPLKSRDNIIGWVPKSQVYKTWSRLGFYPNMDDAAVAERREKGVRASAFATPSEAIAFARDSASGKPVWEESRWAKTADATYCLPVGEVFSAQGIVAGGVWRQFAPAEVEMVLKERFVIGQIQSYGNDYLARARKSNLVFVVDGCDSNAVALEMLVSLFRNWDTIPAWLSVGLVVYRGGNSPRPVSVLKLSRSVERFEGFVEAQADWAWATPQTEVYSPAVFAGIQAGLALFNDKFGEMNELVVLGGYPNPIEDTRISPKALADLQGQTGANIRVFQTYYSAGAAVMAEQVASIFAEGEAEAQSLVPGYASWTSDTLLRDWGLTARTWHNPALSVALLKPVAGKKLHLGTFGVNLLGWINALQAKGEKEYAMRQQTGAICAAIADTASSAITIPQTVDDYWACVYMADAMEFHQDVIFPYKHPALAQPMYKAAVLIEQNAVGAMMGYLKDVLATREGSPEERRNALYDVFLKIAGGYDGMRKSDASALANVGLRELVATNFYDISEQQYVIFKAGSVLPNMPVSALKDKGAFSDDMINVIYLYFAECKEKVEAFSAKPKTFFLGDIQYTWLPLDIAP